MDVDVIKGIAEQHGCICSIHGGSQFNKSEIHGLEMQKEKSSCAVGTRIYSQNRNQRWYTEEESCCFKCIKMWT